MTDPLFEGHEVGPSHLFVVPVTGYFHLHHGDEPFSEQFIEKVLDQGNIGMGRVEEGTPRPARIEAKMDETEAQVWFSPNPTLPQNRRAQQIIADIFHWHMLFYGCVLVAGLNEEQVVDLIKRYG